MEQQGQSKAKIDSLELKAEKNELKRLFIIAVHRNESIKDKVVFLKAIFSQLYKVYDLIEAEAKLSCNTC